MPLQSIVSIVLRLFCIQWFITGLSWLFPMLTSWNGYDTTTKLAMYFGPLFFIVISAVFWVSTPAIARAVTRRDNMPVNTGGLTKHDLYCFAFVLLGLSLLLSNFAATLSYAYQFLVVFSQTHEHDPARNRPVYDMMRYGISLVAGWVTLLYAGRFSTMLIRMEEKHDTPAGAEKNVE